MNNLRSVLAATMLLSATSIATAQDNHATHNTLSAEEAKAGWTLLFDGKDVSQWRNYKKDSVGDGWKVKDGVLLRVDKKAGDIITKKQFTAFELTLDYNISKGGNSGLMYHVAETEEKPWRTGPEIQIQDNVDGHDPQKAGWLYQLYSSETDATHPAGEWNTLRVLITPKQCVHWMNGTKYCEYVKGSDDWKQKVAASKFNAFDQFGVPTTGHICLQDHGNLVSFRNVKIREVK